MNKKLFLAIACPFLALALILTSGWFLWNNKAQTPVIEPKTATQTEAQAESVFPVIPAQQIYGTIEKQGSWNFDFNEPQNFLERANAVVRAKVLSASPARFLTTEMDEPHTPLKVQVLEVLSGELACGKMSVYFPGGAVTAKQLLDNMGNTTKAEKMGLDQLSEKDLKSMYMNFTSELDFDVKTNTEYILVLWSDWIVPNEYFVVGGSYSMFTKDKKNVKTQKELKSTKAGKAKVATNPALEK
jgi:hypothetical protein